MKICQLTSMHDWNDDRIYQRACLGLTRMGYEVHLVATIPDVKPTKEKVVFHWVKQRKGIKRRWLSSKEVIKKAILINADIYHFHDPDLLPHITKLKRRVPNAIIIYDIHENYTARFDQWKATRMFSQFFKRKFRAFEIKIISKISGYTVTTNSMHELFNATNKPWLEIRNTVDISRLKNLDFNQDKFNSPTIYTSGTNSDARNVMETVLSLPEILNFHPKTNMMFVGKYLDNLEDRIKENALENNISDKLIIEGMLPWVDNFLRTSKAFCGCVFYEDNLNNRVTLPNRLFEYMYCGIAVIGTNFKEVRNVIDGAKCGIVVDSSDPKEIAKGIIYLLRNPEKVKQMGVNGRKAIETTYGYHIDLENIVAFYKKLLKFK